MSDPRWPTEVVHEGSYLRMRCICGREISVSVGRDPEEIDFQVAVEAMRMTIEACPYAPRRVARKNPPA